MFIDRTQWHTSEGPISLACGPIVTGDAHTEICHCSSFANVIFIKPFGPFLGLQWLTGNPALFKAVLSPPLLAHAAECKWNNRSGARGVLTGHTEHALIEFISNQNEIIPLRLTYLSTPCKHFIGFSPHLIPVM